MTAFSEHHKQFYVLFKVFLVKE